MSLPRSRKDAREKSSLHYFTGIQCRNGHISKRLTSTGACTECSKASSRLHHQRLQATDEVYRKRNVQRSYENKLKRVYGITIEFLNERLSISGGKCECCGVPMHTEGSVTATRAVVDHCHDTGMFRGVLCNGCNRGIGFFDNSPTKLRKAALYLERIRPE